MKTYFTFQPEYFNNNGDQGNIEVIQFVMKANKHRFTKTDDPKTADFLLVGDASIAVMKHFDKALSKLKRVIAKRYERGEPTLMVGSSYEYFAQELGLVAGKTKRESSFVKSDGFFGYRNSDSTLPVIHIKGSFIGTNLFGPLLAKNPQLLKSMLASLDCEFELDPEVQDWIEVIRQQGA